MQLKTILNRVQKFKSFVYGNVNWLKSDETLALHIQLRHEPTAARSVPVAVDEGLGTTRWDRDNSNS
jgi:hypothetical protein